jgi:hypothetical protein
MTEPRNPRYYSLNAWRGLACLIVVVFHSNIYAATSKPFGPRDEFSVRLSALSDDAVLVWRAVVLCDFRVLHLGLGRPSSAACQFGQDLSFSDVSDASSQLCGCSWPSPFR